MAWWAVWPGCTQLVVLRDSGGASVLLCCMSLVVPTCGDLTAHCVSQGCLAAAAGCCRCVQCGLLSREEAEDWVRANKGSRGAAAGSTPVKAAAKRSSAGEAGRQARPAAGSSRAGRKG